MTNNQTNEIERRIERLNRYISKYAIRPSQERILYMDNGVRDWEREQGCTEGVTIEKIKKKIEGWNKWVGHWYTPKYSKAGVYYQDLRNWLKSIKEHNAGYSLDASLINHIDIAKRDTKILETEPEIHFNAFDVEEGRERERKKGYAFMPLEESIQHHWYCSIPGSAHRAPGNIFMIPHRDYLEILRFPELKELFPGQLSENLPPMEQYDELEDARAKFHYTVGESFLSLHEARTPKHLGVAYFDTIIKQICYAENLGRPINNVEERLRNVLRIHKVLRDTPAEGDKLLQLEGGLGK